MKKTYLYILIIFNLIPFFSIGQLHLNNGAKLEVFSNTLISCLNTSDSIILNDSSVIENNGVINFYNHSGLIEQPKFPIYGLGHEVAIMDSVVNGMNNPGNLGFSFNGNSSMIGYNLYRFHNDSLSLISSYNGVNRYFKFSNTQNIIGANTSFKYDTTELNGLNPNNLKLVHIDNTLLAYQSTESNYVVTGITDSLTTFALTPIEVSLNNVSDTIICGNDSITYDFSSVGPYNTMNTFEFWLINGSDSILLDSSSVDGVYSILIPDSLQASPYSLIIISTDIITSNTYSSLLHINNLPTVVFTDPNPVCENLTEYVLNTASPTGGLFNGAGVVNDSIFPSAIGNGNYTITYSYTDVNGCSNLDTALMIIHPVDSVNFPTQPDLCDNDSYLLLNAQPSGGVYSGIGVLGDYFDPTIGSGNYLLSYIYTNALGCVDSNSSSVNVFSSPSTPLIIQNGDVLSTDNNLFYQWYFNGNAIPGETGQFIVCDSSGFFQVEVSNAVGCSSLSIPYNFSLSSINNLSDNSNIDVFPNPANNYLMFESSVLHSGFSIKIFNVEGQLIMDLNHKNSGEKIDISNLVSGTYFVNFQNEYINQVRKINVIK